MVGFASIRTSVVSLVKKSSKLYAIRQALGKRSLLTQYRARRERYNYLADQLGLNYSEATTKTEARKRLSDSGRTPKKREFGSVHTLAFVPEVGWHSALLPDLEELGPVSRFDYTKLGILPQHLYRFDTDAFQMQKQINEEAISFIIEANNKRPIDWLFVYASGLEVQADMLKRVREEIGIPIIGMCLDDKQSWVGRPIGKQRSGQIDILREFGLSWTSARIACEWYLCEGGRPYYQPEGFDSRHFKPLQCERSIPVSFIGDAYGFRPSVIAELKRGNIPLSVFGSGWGKGTAPAYGDEQVRVINQSQINLGMGGIGYSEELTNVKTRDFEIPGTGGGAYLTSFNSDLAQHLHIGSEILCYRSIDEMKELIRYYLHKPQEAEEISKRGRERCLREHRWLHRYQRILELIGVL